MVLWRQIQKENFRDGKALLRFLEIEKEIPQTPFFPINIPKRLAEKMEKGNPNDPLLLQFLPTFDETKERPGFSSDPVAEMSFQKTPRLLQKYGGRSLLVTTSTCVMNCRFCFRQNYPYLPEKDFSEELKVIANDPTIAEVILSGGDPLSLSDEKLKKLIESLEQIPHLKLLRFHTRFPIGIPERITPDFIKILQETRLQPIFVLHTNHPNELGDDLFTALKKLQMPLLSQTVLLKGINDNMETLESLFLTLVSNGVIPYYLHQLDRVKQASHFEVAIDTGLSLIEALRARVPGYALPRYVQEVPHRNSKTEISIKNNISCL